MGNCNRDKMKSVSRKMDEWLTSKEADSDHTENGKEESAGKQSERKNCEEKEWNPIQKPEGTGTYTKVAIDSNIFTFTTVVIRGC